MCSDFLFKAHICKTEILIYIVFRFYAQVHIDLNMTLQQWIISYLETFSMWIQMSRELDGFLPHIHLAFNRFWFLQTLICIFYCIKVRRFFPAALNSNHFAILQFNIVLITNSLL